MNKKRIERERLNERKSRYWTGWLIDWQENKGKEPRTKHNRRIKEKGKRNKREWSMREEREERRLKKEKERET